MSRKSVFSIVLLLCVFTANAQFKIAQLKYNGGGDWYANPTALTNLIAFCNKEVNANINEAYEYVEASSAEVFNYPFIHLTGHGNIVFSSDETENLRSYLQSGGFIHISDNYGMDKFIRAEFEKVLPTATWQLVALSHPIYKTPFAFEKGLPKIHEHDGKAPQGLGLFIEGRLAVFYDFECDLSDGWEDKEVHNDPEKVRTQALQMGANLIHYAFTNPVQVK